jgi:hypothetical protein
MQDAKENVSRPLLSPTSPLSVSPEGVARELTQLAAALETLAPPETKASELSAFAAEDFLRAEEKRHRSADAAFNYLHLRRAALSAQDLQAFAELSHRYFAKVLLSRTLIQELRTQRPLPVQVVLVDNWLKQYQELGQSVHMGLPTAAWVDFCAHASDILAAKGYLQPERILPAVPETKTREAEPAPPLDLRQHTAWQEYYEELYSRLTNELLAARAILTDRLQEAATPADTVISTVTGAIPVVGQALGKIAGTASAVVKHRSVAEVAAWAKTLPEIDQLARWLARTFVEMRHEQLLTLTESDFSTLTQLQQKWKEVREKDSFSLARKLALQDLRLVLELLPQCARSNVLDAERRVAENVATVQQAFQQHLIQTAQPQPPTLPLLERVKQLPEQIGPLKKKAVLAFTLSAPAESPKDKKAEASSPTDEAGATLLSAVCLTLPQTSDTANAWQFQQAGILAATTLKENTTHRQIGGASLTHLQTAGSLQQRTDYWAARCMIRLADLTANATPAWAGVMALWHDVSAYMAISGGDAQQSLWQRLHTVWSSQAAEDISQRALQQQIASITTVAACQMLHAQVMDLIGGLSRAGQHTVAEALARQYTDRARQAFAQAQAKSTRLQTEAKQTRAQDQQRQARRDSWSQKLQSWQQQLAAIRGPAASGEPVSPSVSPAEMTPTMQHFAQTLQEAWRQDKTLAVLEEQYAKQYALWQQHQRQGLPSAADTFQTLEVGLTQLQRLIAIEQAQNTTTVQTQEELLATQQLCQVWETNSENAMAQYRALTSPSASSSQAFAQSFVITTPKPEQKNASTNLVQRLEAELGEPPCGFAMLTASIIVTADDKPRSHAAYTTAAEPHVALLMTDPSLQDHPYWRAYAQLWQWHRQCQDPLHAMATTVQVWIGTPGALPQHVLWATCEGHSQTDAPQATQLFADYQQQCRAHLQTASAEQVPFARSYGYHGLQALFSRPLPYLPTADQPLSISEVLLTPLQDLILQLGLYYGVSVATLNSCSAVLDALASQARFSPAFIVDLRAALSWAESQQAHATTPVAHRGSPLTPAQRRELQQHYQYTVQALWQRCHTTAEREPLWRLTGELPQQFDPLWEGFEATCTALRKGTIPLEGIDRALDFLAQVLVHRQQFAWTKHRQYLFDLPADQRLAYVEKLAQALPPAQHSLVTRLHHVPLPNGRRLTQEIEQRDWEKAVQQLWQPAEGAIAAESKSSNSSTPIQFVRARQVAGITGPQWQLETHVLHPTIARQLFKPNGEWQDKDKQHGGNHRVYPIAAGGKVLFWVKVYPEQPASEFLVTELDRRLGIGGTPHMELVKFQHGGKTSAAVLTAAINGIDLQTVVDKTPDQLKRLSFAAFIRTLLRVLLTNPEDDKGDDYFLIPQADGSCALVRIDNERAFFQPSSERQKLLFKSEHLLVKSIIYCLEQMQWQWADDPAVVAVLEDFLHLQPVALVSDLLQTADQLHDGWNQLFSEGEVTAHFNCKDPWASLPVMCIPNGLARELITRLTVMHTALRLEHAQMTGLQLLKVTQPKLAQYYVASHSSLSSPTKTTLLTPFRAEQKGAAPLESKRRASTSMITTRETADHSRVSARFERVAGHLYQKKNLKDAHSAQHSLMPSSVAMQSSLRLESPIDLATLQKIRSKQTCSAKQQLSEFDQWQKSQRLRLIGDLAAQKTTAVAEWQGLPLRQQYQVFTQLQAQQLSVAQQRFILQALAAVVSETAWPQLIFKGFENTLTDALLEPLLKGSGQQLLKLNLDNCRQLTDKSFQTLVTTNPNLRQLSAQQAKWTNFSLTPFPQLEQLDLSGSQVQTVVGEAPCLHRLELVNCRELSSLGSKQLLQSNSFFAPQLTQVNLSNCIRLNKLAMPQMMFLNKNFVQALSSCTTLTSIDLQLKKNWIGVPKFLLTAVRDGVNELSYSLSKNLGYYELDPLLNYLAHDCAITSLLTSHVHFSDENAPALTKLLKSNTTITHLSIGNSYLGKLGVQALAQGLKSNMTVTYLDLSNNTFKYSDSENKKGEIAKIVADMLKINTTLTSLSLNNNSLRDWDAEILAEALGTNTILTSLDIENNLFGNRGERACQEIRKHLTRNIIQKTKLAQSSLSLRDKKKKEETKDVPKTPITLSAVSSSLESSPAVEASSHTTTSSISSVSPQEHKVEVEVEAIAVPPSSPLLSVLPAPHSQFFSPSVPRDEKAVTLLAEVQHALDQVYPEHGDTRQAYLMQLAEFQSRPGILSKPEREALQGLLTTLREAAIQRMAPPSDPSVLD